MTNKTPSSSNLTSFREAETCLYLDYMAWQTWYLTDGTYINLVIIASVNSIAAIATILLNALVIVVVATKRQLRTHYNILLACLAGADLLVGGLVQPLLVVVEVKHILSIPPFCAFHTVCVVVSYGTCVASISHLVLISVERYFFIKHPLRYEAVVTEGRITTGILTAWAFAAVVTIIAAVLAIVDSETELYWILLTIGDVLVALVSLVFIVVIGYTSVVIFVEARRLKRRLQTEQLSEEEAKRLKKDNKAANTLKIILAAILLSYMPTVILIGYTASSGDLIEPHVLYVLLDWCFTFVLLGSFFNPLIYCWRIKKLRRALLDILQSRQPQTIPDVQMLEIHRHHNDVQPPSTPDAPAMPEPLLFSTLKPTRLPPIVEVDC